MVGLCWATATAIFGNRTQFFTSWMVPFYLILALFFAPTCTVHIKDPTTQDPPRTVENVPWGLGAFAGTISKISDSITKKIESVTALPDDLKYHKTGSMMASNLIAQSRTFRITDYNLSETMKDFSHQCVMYDALIGNKYTIDDLRNSTNLWQLVSENLDL